jgi:hypothetical protein
MERSKVQQWTDRDSVVVVWLELKRDSDVVMVMMLHKQTNNQTIDRSIKLTKHCMVK